MKKTNLSKLSFLNKLQAILLNSISYTNSIDSINNRFIQFSLIFSAFQLIYFLLKQSNYAILNSNLNDDYNNSSINSNEQHLISAFKVMASAFQILMVFDDAKILYFIITYMTIQFITLAVAALIKYPIIHYAFSLFILYHTHIFAFFIHNKSIEYAFNENAISNSYLDQYGLILALKILLIFLDLLSLLLCVYYDMFFYNNHSHYILTKYSNIINIIYHFSRITIVIIAYLTSINHTIRVFINSLFMMLVCIVQLYLLIKYNIFTIWKTIRFYVISYTIILFISLISILSTIFDYNIYILTTILIIIPLACKIVVQYTLYLYLNRVCKKKEMFRSEWECLAHYYSFQNLTLYPLQKSKLTIDSTLRIIILNGLMAEYNQLYSQDKTYYCNWNNTKLNLDQNNDTHFQYDQTHFDDFSQMLLENYLEKFPTSPLIKLQLILSLITEKKLYTKALLMLESMVCKNKEFSITQRFTIFNLRKIIKNNINNKPVHSRNNNYDIDIVNFIKFLDYMEEFHHLLNTQLVNAITFWQELLKSEIELIIAYNNAQKIFILHKTIQALWLKIDNACQRKISKPYLLYSLYNYVVINSKNTGDRMQQIYIKILNMNIILEDKIKENIYNTENDNQFDVFSESNLHFIISGEKYNLGMIINCSDNIVHTLGYRKVDLIKHNISIIIPPIYRKHHQMNLNNYINDICKTLYDHASEMHFINKNIDLCTCKIIIKDLYHRVHGMIFFVLIQPTNLNNDFIIMDDNGIIDCMSKRLKREIGFQEKSIPKNIHIDSICVNLVSIEEFYKQKGTKNQSILEDSDNKLPNGYIIQFISLANSDLKNDNNQGNHYFSYIEKQVIREELVIRKAILKKLGNKDLNLTLLRKYKEKKDKVSVIKSCINKDLDNIPNEESIDYGLLNLKVGLETMSKKFILKDNVIIEESKSPINYRNLPNEKITHMFSEFSIGNFPNTSYLNPLSTQEQLPKILGSNVISPKTGLKIDPIIKKTLMNSSSQLDIADYPRNSVQECDLKNTSNTHEIENLIKVSDKNPRTQIPDQMITTMPNNSNLILNHHKKPFQSSQPKFLEDILESKPSDNEEKNIFKLLKKSNQIKSFEICKDMDNGNPEHQKLIEKALKVEYFLKDIHYMKGFIYLFLIIHLIFIVLTIYWQTNSVYATKTSIAILKKNNQKIGNLLDIRLYARLLCIIDSYLLPIDRLTDMNISDYHKFWLLRLNEKQYLLNQANSEFLDFLYNNIDQKYRDEIALTEIRVHWDFEDQDLNTHGFSFSEQKYPISTVVNLIAHQTFMLVHFNLSTYNLLNPQLNFILNNIGGTLLIHNFKYSDIFQQALFEYLEIYLNIQAAVFCLGWILILISWGIIIYIMYRLFIEKIKILTIFTLIQPEEIKTILKRFSCFEYLLKSRDDAFKNIDKYLDQHFTIKSIKNKFIKQEKIEKPKIISKQIKRFHIASFAKLSLLIGTLGIYYSLSFNNFINFEEQNKILIHKIEFLNEYWHNLILVSGLAYQFLQRNATGFAYHDYPESGNITTFLSLELQKEKNVMNFINELSGLNPKMDYLLSEKLCDINTNISEYQCLKFANGALNRGLIGISSYIYETLHNIYQSFLDSNRTSLEIEQILYNSNLKDLEIILIFYLEPVFNSLSSILDQSFEEKAKYRLDRIKITQLYLLFG